MDTPSSEVGPGFLGFLVFFVLAIALWLLMRNMFSRLRRMRLAEDQRAREAAAADARRDPQDQRITERARTMDLPGRPGSSGAGSRPGSRPAGGASGVGDRPEEGQGRRREV